MKKHFPSLLFLFLFQIGFIQAQECNCPDFMGFDSNSLEDAFKRPSEIKSMDIAMQKLSSIDARIGELKNLECLDLSFNRFSTLPAEFANLENLQCLKLTGCRFLSSVPEILKKLPNLKYLDISDHPEWSAKQFEAAVEMLPGVKVVY